MSEFNSVMIIRAMLRKCLSAKCFGVLGIILGLACLAIAGMFFTTWWNVIEADRYNIPRGVFMPNVSRFAFAYCGIALLWCSAVTMDIWNVRAKLARRLGEGWKLMSASVGVLLASSVAYFLVAFVATHIDFVVPHPDRPTLYYASFFGYGLLLPTLGFSYEDVFTSFFMFVTGIVAFALFLFVSLNDFRSFRSRLPGELWGTMAVGFSFLAADELFDLHRVLGRNLPLLRGMDIHSEPGVVVFAIYGIIAAGILFAYKHELWRNRVGSRMLIAGIGIQCIALGLDMWGKFSRREEILEIIQAALWFVAIIYFAHDELVSYIDFRTRKQS